MSAEHFPRLMHTALEATDVRGLAEFYRRLLGLRYRPGDEPPADGVQDDADWLVLVDRHGVRRLAFQQVEQLTPTTWPEPDVPMQLHLDLRVDDVAALERHRARAGGRAGGDAVARPHRLRGAAPRARRPRRAPVLPARQRGLTPPDSSSRPVARNARR